MLVVRGKSVTIMDMEGKDIGKSTSIRMSGECPVSLAPAHCPSPESASRTDLQTLKEGQSLLIGGKEVEIMGTISQELFTSGKCFLSVAAPAPVAAPRLPSGKRHTHPKTLTHTHTNTHQHTPNRANEARECST